MPVINPQDIKELRALVEEQLKYTLCVSLNKATQGDIFNAVALAIRHFQQDHFLSSQARQRGARKKRVYYHNVHTADIQQWITQQTVRFDLIIMTGVTSIFCYINKIHNTDYCKNRKQTNGFFLWRWCRTLC